MEIKDRSKRYTVIAFLLLMPGCIGFYHYQPADPVPTKAAEVTIDCKSRYLNTIEAVRNADGSGYSYSYTCSDYPPTNVKVIVRE